MKARAAILFFFLSFGAISFADERFENAKKLYEETKYKESLQFLDEKSGDQETILLLGKNYYQLGEADKDNYKTATDFFEKAANINPRNAEYLLWLGKAWGRRAETAGFLGKLKVISYAGKARQYFEAAHSADPKNHEAAWVTFLYYLEAPGFLGGGIDKAKIISGEIAKLDAAEGECTLAFLEEKRKNFSGAKAHWLDAIKINPSNTIIAVEYAKFLKRHKDYGEAEVVLIGRRFEAPNTPSVNFELARLYFETGRRNEAREILEKYINPDLTPLTPEDPSRFEAEKLLKKIS